MSLTLFLVVALVISIGLAVVFFTKNKQLSETLLRAELTNRQTISEKDAIRMELSQSVKETALLREQMTYERRKKTEDEQQLKEHLKAIAKEVVQEGNSAIKQENRSQLEQLLQPFKEKLSTFENEVRDNKEKGLQQHASMESLVKALSDQHLRMNNTAQNLADALRGEQKTQGDWGELALERILEMSGLKKDSEYLKQPVYRDEHNNMLRPDFVIKLPDDKHIIIDSKVSLKAYERFVNAENDTDRTVALRDHVFSVNNHLKLLGDKNYTHLEGLHNPEFVLMFLPLEASFSLAMKEEPGIYNRAWEKRIVIVTPSTLLATLKTVESIWKQERQNVNAVKIAIEAGRLYDKFVGFVDDLKKIEKNQADLTKNYREAFSKLSEGPGNLVGKIENLKRLGAKASKQIDQHLLGDDEPEG